MGNSNTSARPAQTTGRVQRIGKVKAATMISEAGGRFFTATFITKNGEPRTMTCRRHVTKGVKGTGNKNADTTALGIITVYDMLNKGFRKMNLQTLTNLKINKATYRVV